MSKARAFLTITAAAALAGCVNLAPDYERPAAELPAKWTDAPGRSATELGERWWQVYGDARLDALVDEALTSNANLAIAVARVDEARAQLRAAGTASWPVVTAGLGAARTRSSLSTGIPQAPGQERAYENYRATLDVSYELDLWRRIGNTTAAARAELLATEAARDTVRIALAADVVQAYFGLRALDQQLAANRRSLAARGESLALQRLRREHGLISEFELRRLEADVEAARAVLPGLERARAQQATALAVLLGREPVEIFNAAAATPDAASGDDAAAQSAPVVPAGLPSELLLRRPDLVEAEQRLIAANARIGVARAKYFPYIDLTGFLGSESAALSDLFTGPAGISRVAVALLQPVWNDNRLGAELDAAKARERQALEQYRQAVRNAFADVHNALVVQATAREQFEAEDRRVAALRESQRLADIRYRNGVASQLDVLDAERNLLDAEFNRADALRAQRAAVADLLKALGGSWEHKDRVAGTPG